MAGACPKKSGADFEDQGATVGAPSRDATPPPVQVCPACGTDLSKKASRREYMKHYMRKRRKQERVK